MVHTKGADDTCEAYITQDLRFNLKNFSPRPAYLRILGAKTEASILIPEIPVDSRLCYEKLLPSGKDSDHFYLSDLDVAKINSDDTEIELATSLVQHLMAVAGCQDSETEIYHTRSECSNIIKDHPTSQSCYIETKAGFFFVVFDTTDNANIIFNRWD